MLMNRPKEKMVARKQKDVERAERGRRMDPQGLAGPGVCVYVWNQNLTVRPDPNPWSGPLRFAPAISLAQM